MTFHPEINNVSRKLAEKRRIKRITSPNVLRYQSVDIKELMKNRSSPSTPRLNVSSSPKINNNQFNSSFHSNNNNDSHNNSCYFSPNPKQKILEGYELIRSRSMSAQKIKTNKNIGKEHLFQTETKEV